MPYTPPNTVTGSDVLTAALWNTQVKDNLNELRNPPFCKVILTSTVTSYTSNTDITWSSAQFNVGSMWSSGQPTRITASQTGLYLVTFNCHFSTGPGANACQLAVKRTPPATATSTAFNTLVPRVQSGVTPGQVVSGLGVMTSALTVLRLVQGEYLTFTLFANGLNGSGSLSPIDITGSATEVLQTNASVLFVGAIA